MDNIIIQLALVLSLASVFGYITLKLKLPLTVAYLIAGVVLSASSLFDISHSLILHTLPELGIALVLFIIGMELDLREIKSLGLPIIVSAVGQVIISTFLGFFVAQVLGFTHTESLYLGLGLAFSSTIVVVKMLLEKRDLGSLYGKLSIGILLIEDLIAIGVLMILSVGNSALGLGVGQSWPIIALILKAIGLFILTFVLSKLVLKRIFDSVAGSTELLFFTAITWCFVFTSLAILSGFSVVVGAFLAGVALASSPYHMQIQGKIKPLRDFFTTLFFVYLGSQVRIADLLVAWPTILILTFFALIIKPVVYLILLSFFGFRKHTLFQTALNLSQISEFSLIVLVVGLEYQVISPVVLSIMAAVGVLSIISSSTLIFFSNQLYKALSPLLSPLEHRAKTHFLEQKNSPDLDKHLIIIGADRVGGPIIKYLQKTSLPFLVVDFNPNIAKNLRDDGVNVVYGDIGDPEIIESIHLEKAKIIISTANSIGDNQLLLEEHKRHKSKALIIVRADDTSQAKSLKLMGADYVILPEKVSGDYIVEKLKNKWAKKIGH